MSMGISKKHVSYVVRVDTEQGGIFYIGIRGAFEDKIAAGVWFRSLEAARKRIAVWTETLGLTAEVSVSIIRVTKTPKGWLYEPVGDA
jgi:hypothetical protein